MYLEIVKAELAQITAFRDLFLHESNFQFICNKCHDYGWADTYLFMMNNVGIGYGSVWGTDRREHRDTIFEFYVIKPYRQFSALIFEQFAALSKVLMIEAQSNDLLLSSMLYTYSRHVVAEALLFEDSFTTNYAPPGVIFRQSAESDGMQDDKPDYVLVWNDNIVASGGLMFNYNKPYADIYMQVKEPFRRQGIGTYIVQELKKTAYLLARVPAARCNINNHISKATLLKAGFKVCGYRLKGEIKMQVG